jgi:hypothetical protein
MPSKNILNPWMEAEGGGSKTDARRRKLRVKRRCKRRFNRHMCEVVKNDHDIARWSRVEPVPDIPVPSTRAWSLRQHSRIFTPRLQAYQGRTLLTIGYGLWVTRQYATDGSCIGFGLRTLEEIPANTPITQYCGEVLSLPAAEHLRSRDPTLASHFCSTGHGAPVINGYRVGEPGASAEPGGGFLLSFDDIRGKGGGSICNHGSENTANARFVRPQGKNIPAFCVLVVSARAILSGEFINVSYTKSFVRSPKAVFTDLEL